MLIENNSSFFLLQWHRIIMLSAFATCIASFVIIFLEVEGWAYVSIIF